MCFERSCPTCRPPHCCLTILLRRAAQVSDVRTRERHFMFWNAVVKTINITMVKRVERLQHPPVSSLTHASFPRSPHGIHRSWA